MNLGIFGSGYGLYGYAAAAAKLGWNIFIPVRYRAKIISRPELSGVLSQATFIPNESNLFDFVDSVAIATPPQIQFDLVMRNLNTEVRYFLEKPLAPDFESRNLLIDRLGLHHAVTSVGYLFPYTDWGGRLLNAFRTGSVSKLEVRWSIPKPISDWKSNISDGGGIKNFYAVHWLHFLISAGLEIEKIHFCEKNSSVLTIKHDDFEGFIEISLAEKSNFRLSWINDGDLNDFELETPFGQQFMVGIEDPRVNILAEYMSSPDLNFSTAIHDERVINNFLD